MSEHSDEQFHAKPGEPIVLDPLAGNHISAVCEEAARKATAANRVVMFEFNGTKVTVQPGETPEAIQVRWTADFEAAAEAYRNSDEYKEAQRRHEEEEHRRATCSMKEAAQTEAEMRDAKVPTPYTAAQLTEYIESLLTRPHDYGTCVYAMSMAATAAFNHVAHVLGVTGFQASCADLDILRRTRRLEGPFILLKGEDMPYPQYDLIGKLTEAMNDWRPWLAEQAQKKLAENNGLPANPNVQAHWKRLAEIATKQ